MTRETIRRTIGACALAALVATAGCGDVARTGRAPSFLIIDSLTAASGATPNDFGSVLFSDVQTLVDQQISGQTVRVPTIFSDSGRASLRLGLKNPGTDLNPNQPSTINQITLTRYRVTFQRADGRNTPGVDVPYGFDGGATVTVGGSSTVTIGFDIVRHQMKEEPPLRNLVNSGGANLISTIATVTFYGRDQAGNDVSVEGQITVNFGDFGDPQ
ncbi:MAG: hypothetical protein AB7O67_13440 [Vicinamibacterales bacterium]